MSEENSWPRTVSQRLSWALEMERRRSGRLPSCIILGRDTYLALCIEVQKEWPASREPALTKFWDQPIYIVALPEALQLGYDDWHDADRALREEKEE